MAERPARGRAPRGYDRFEPVERRITIRGTEWSLWRPPDLESLIDLEAFAADERIPYWADVWESAIVLAEDLALLDGAGRRLVELGCGLGLPALVAARRGFTVTATDYEEPALEGVRYNAARNGVCGLQTRVVDWRTPPTDLPPQDYVVAADVLYEKHHPAALAGVIAALLAADGVGLVADPGRARAEEFPAAAAAAGLVATPTGARRPEGVAAGPAVEVWRVVRRPA
ncbi:MAG: class I SAM-dependent methyltransferase [Planctomycetota bacterium]